MALAAARARERCHSAHLQHSVLVAVGAAWDAHAGICEVAKIVAPTDTGSVRVKRILRGTSWTPPWDGNQKSATAVRRRRPLRVALPSPIFDFRPRASPSWSLSFHHFATPGTPRGSLTEGHIKVMLAYGCRLSHDHQDFRSFITDHREAAGPVGPAVARVKVHCDLQTVPSCALATASTAVM